MKMNRRSRPTVHTRPLRKNLPRWLVLTMAGALLVIYVSSRLTIEARFELTQAGWLFGISVTIDGYIQAKARSI